MIDDPVRASLDGDHAPLARREGRAVAYLAEVGPFSAQPRDAAEAEDLARLLGPGAITVQRTLHPSVPAGWAVAEDVAGVQMVYEGPRIEEPDGWEPLGDDDVPEMLDLVARTQPGPFLSRTVAMGRYLGVRENGALVAMAGERLHPPGGTEVSAVCTDPAHRGRGLAGRLVRAVAAGVQARGATPFLHTKATNTPAIRLYEQLGFRLCARPSFVALRTPERAPDRVADRGGWESPAPTTALGEP